MEQEIIEMQDFFTPSYKAHSFKQDVIDMLQYRLYDQIVPPMLARIQDDIKLIMKDYVFSGKAVIELQNVDIFVNASGGIVSVDFYYKDNLLL